MEEADKERIERLRAKYESPDNVALIQEWEERLKAFPQRKEYLDMDMTKTLVAFLRTRVTDMRKIKATSESITTEELKLYNARIKECMIVLGFISPNIEKEIESLRIEADRAIEQSSMG